MHLNGNYLKQLSFQLLFKLFIMIRLTFQPRLLILDWQYTHPKVGKYFYFVKKRVLQKENGETIWRNWDIPFENAFKKGVGGQNAYCYSYGNLLQ